MKKVGVLHIIGDSTLTGAPVSLLTLVKGLDKKKFKIQVACPPGLLAGRLKEIKGIEVFVIPMHSKWDLRAISKLRKLISHLRQGYGGQAKLIVHCHGVRGGFLGRLACIGPQKTAPKVIYTEHLWTAEYKLKSPISHIIQIFGLWFLDLVTSKTIAVSKAVANFLIKKRITRPEKVIVIYNGVEQRVRAKSKSEKISKLKPPNSKLIGFVGSLVKRKGVEYLLRAVSGINSKLIIVGEGPEKDSLRELAKKLRINRQVEFKGFVEDLSDFYPLLDVYIQPSLDEAFGIAALEALSYGVPVITSRVGGLTELLNLDKWDPKKPYELTDYGILVEPRNPAALTEAILKILKDKKLAKKMAMAALKRAKEFSAERMVKETEKLYSFLIE